MAGILLAVVRPQSRIRQEPDSGPAATPPTRTAEAARHRDPIHRNGRTADLRPFHQGGSGAYSERNSVVLEEGIDATQLFSRGHD